MTTSAGVDLSKVTRPSPLACIECRKKHLKCDAAVPVCSRCTARGLQCSYTPSRRGISGRTRKVPSPRHVVPSLPPTPSYEASSYILTSTHHQGPQSATTGSGSLSEFRPPSPRSTWTDPSEINRLEATGTAPSTPASISSQSSLRSEDEFLTNLYYSQIHSNHPVLVPRTRYATQAYPEALQAVIKFIGSQYTPNISSDNLKEHVSRLVANLEEKTPETVQTLLLYTMALHARYEPMEAMEAITRAADIAIELGMHRSCFANRHGHGDAIYEESLRRTWWELYATDGYIAALHRHTNFRSNTVQASTYLPCEESLYIEGNVPSNPLSLQQFDGRLFASDEWQFSSFCYRIDAVRILARVMAVSTTNEAHADAIQSIDNAIASWKFHLPNDKAGLVDTGGELDPIMFQAYTIINCASIFLHFPRSELPITMPPAAEITCARQHMEQVSPTSTQHGMKAMAASKDIANLAALPMQKYSPGFICALVFGCIVQLSACSAYPRRNSVQQNRDRIALILGVLKSLSRYWGIADYVSNQLKRAANEIFNPRPEASATTSTTSYDSAVDLNIFPTDLSWLDFVEGIHPPALSGNDLAGL